MAFVNAERWVGPSLRNNENPPIAEQPVAQVLDGIDRQSLF